MTSHTLDAAFPPSPVAPDLAGGSGAASPERGAPGTARPSLHVQSPLDAEAPPLRHEGDARCSDTIGLGATVVVTGDLIAEALIRGATVTVGGALRALAGIQGKGGGPIRVGGAMFATYLDSVSADVFGPLEVERQIVASSLVIHGHLLAPGAALIGGQTTVRGRVELGTAGSESCVPTLLILGTVPSLEPRLVELTALAERLAKEQASAEREAHQLSLPGQVLNPQQKERHTEVSFQLHELQSRVTRCLAAREAGLSVISRVRTIELSVRQMIYPGFTIACFAQSLTFRREVPGPVRLFADPHGELLYQSEGQASPAPLQAIAELKARSA